MPKLKQDLHIHTIFSSHDGAVAPEQTIELIAAVRHAEITGISDHFEDIMENFNEYSAAVRKLGFFAGTEVDGSRSVGLAVQADADYYIYHCRDEEKEYKAAERLLETGKPVIIAHPNFLSTNLEKVPPRCLIEISNRYVWRSDWRRELTPFIGRFKFILSSDAHQPNWLNHTMAEYVAQQLGIENTILF